MSTVADLIRWRDRLVEARLSGIQTLVDQSGERIEYKSDRQMAAAIASADAAIAAATRKQPNTIVFRTHKRD